MRFIGCSLPWRPGESKDGFSTLVVLDERGGLIADSFAVSIEEVVSKIKGYASDRGIVVGIDAPLSVPNERGTRAVERVLSKVALPSYSASRKMFGGEETYAERLLAAFEEEEMEYTDYPFPRLREQRAVAEVDSLATLKILLLEQRGGSNGGDPEPDLRAMQEPKLRKGNKEERAGALKEAVGVLWNTPGLRMRTGRLTADLTVSENVDLSGLSISSELSHAELDRASGLVEGTLSAYTVYRHWRGRDGSMIVGSGRQGSVLLPASGTLHERLAAESRAAGVPYV